MTASPVGMNSSNENLFVKDAEMEEEGNVAAAEMQSTSEV